MSDSPATAPGGEPAPAGLRERTAARFDRVRAATERLTAGLQPEELRAQTMEDVSPPYWNLGHTSWFFAANLLRPAGRAPRGFDRLDYVLNSYYEGLGPRLERGRRGAVAWPPTALVRDYRAAVDEAVRGWIAACPAAALAQVAQLVTIGCEHEQQHQELFVTELQHIRWTAAAAGAAIGAPGSTERPAAAQRPEPGPLGAVGFEAAETTLGYQGRVLADGGFCWDNETPAHRALVGDYVLGDRLVTNGEWLAFVQDGGYRDPLLWLSNGWDFVRREGLEAPLYWQRDGAGGYDRFSLRGLLPLDAHAPVCNLSFYEAEAFARWWGEHHDDWRGARLPREVEWEHAARRCGFDRGDADLLDDRGALVECDVARPRPGGGPLRQLAGTCWEWTVSHYEPYPGYRPFDGALMEYNGKFMDNQRVLRGGSFATPRAQARVAYRNFWAPTTRFQASGLRLCADR